MTVTNHHSVKKHCCVNHDSSGKSVLTVKEVEFLTL